MDSIVYDTPNGYGKHIAEYDNGIMTTAGFFNKEEISIADNYDGPILYVSAAALSLPFDWPNKLWVDDRGSFHKIRKIDYKSLHDCEITAIDVPVFIMDDFYKSTVVVEVVICKDKEQS